MPVITKVYVQCDECGFEHRYGEADSLEAGTDDIDVIRERAISNARGQGFSVTDRGTFCGSNGRCRFDQRWQEQRIRGGA